MKAALRVLLVGAALLALAVAALEGVRSRLEHSDALRQSLEGAAAAQLGVSLRAGPIEVGFLPARLWLRAPVLELSEELQLELGEARIELELGSLLAGSARLLALEAVGPARLRWGRLDLSGDLRLGLRPDAAPGDWRVDAVGQLDSGGRFALRGLVRPGGGFSGEADLEDLESEPVASLLTSEAGGHPRLAGSWSGRLEFPASGAPAVLRLDSQAAEMHIPPIALVGPVSLVAQLPARASSDPAPSRFAIDASRARVEYAGGLTKASGQGASITGTIVRGAGDRWRLEDVALKIQRFRAQRSANDGD